MPAPLISILCHDADIAHAETLHKFLKPQENQGALRVWHPGLIPHGATKKKERDRHLNDAHLVTLLISTDFRADPDLQGEAKRLIEAKKHVVPIRVRHTSTWKGEPYEDLRSLATLTASDPEGAWGKAADSLLALIAAPAPTPAPRPLPAAAPAGSIATPTTATKAQAPAPNPQATSPSPQTLTWVQLGGLAGQGEALTWETLREALLRDADEMSAQLGAPALLFLTGDLAVWEDADPFQRAKDLLDRLRERWPGAQSFFAPGPRDVRAAQFPESAVNLKGLLSLYEERGRRRRRSCGAPSGVQGASAGACARSLVTGTTSPARAASSSFTESPPRGSFLATCAIR
jgi:hypothetical protein